jgi:predicted nuclease with TOPRIM domain
MNDILSATIAQLAARQEVIATSKAGKASKEEEIKAQIKDLQAQLKELESEMSTLDSESDKITANIAELENMKLDPVKEHNVKRVKK